MRAYHLPSMENHHFQWVNPLFLWQFSIAMLVYQRVIPNRDFPRKQVKVVQQDAVCWDESRNPTTIDLKPPAVCHSGNRDLIMITFQPHDI